jgi:hypothetical protein
MSAADVHAAGARCCEVAGCEKPHYAKGMCQMHRQRWLRVSRGALPRPAARRQPGDPSIGEFGSSQPVLDKLSAEQMHLARLRVVWNAVDRDGVRLGDRYDAAAGLLTREQAARYVTFDPRNVADARRLLDALGLLGEPEPVRHLTRPDVTLRRRP